MDNLKQVCSAFQLNGVNAVYPITAGHINQTLCVETETGRFILQRMNTQVFPSISILMKNIELYLKHRGPCDMQSPAYRQTSAGHFIFEDAVHQAWRAYPWIEGRVLKQVSCQKEAYACGLAYGAFNRSVETVPVSDLKLTIPGFFDLKQRLLALDQAVQQADPLRLKKIARVLLGIAAQRDALQEAFLFGERYHLQKRCIHADTKPSNVLFHPTETKAVAVIDLDMLSAYYLYYDFADGARSIANAADESGLNAHIDFGLLKGFAKGFLEPLQSDLTPIEKESLVCTLPCVSFMLTVRFATDYCENDRYFRIEDPDHNLRRAEAQYKITEDLSHSDAKDCVREACQLI